MGLFPHLTVAANVATVPRLLGWNKRRQQERANELLELVGLDPKQYGPRYPSQLSGGQRQRVGVARALGADPEVLLMDEPFSRHRPDRPRPAAGRVPAACSRRSRKTILFVTHDIDEAVRLGDRVAVFRQGGLLEQYDTPARMLGAPATPFVADFVGMDRRLRRLAVTPIDLDDLEHPPVVSQGATERPRSGRRSTEPAAASSSTTEAGCSGRSAPTRLTGTAGTAASVRRAGGRRRSARTLKDALSLLLRDDDGWVGVVDGERYVGTLTPGLAPRGPAAIGRGGCGAWPRHQQESRD